MHSKIFQISINKVKDFITEDRYSDSFVGYVADYVSDLDQDIWKENWNWLSDYAKGAIEIKNNMLTIIDKRKFFEGHYAEFKELIKKAEDISLEQFMSNDYGIEITTKTGNTYKTSASSLVSNINCTFDDKHGFYIDDYDEYYGLKTFDSFMRCVNDGEVFYLGSVIDYHF